jgi:dual specificity protein kinase YAK1
LNLNPIERWSPQQARLHPFITGEKFTKPFVVSRNDIQSTRDHFFTRYQPSGHPSQQQVATSAVSPTTATSDPKRPFGGLVPSQPKGTRAFQDAASYNQHLAQHQAYTAQAQAASQAANNVFRNPYITTQLQSQPSSSAYPASAADPGNTYSQPPQPQHSPYATSSQSQGVSFWDWFMVLTCHLTGPNNNSGAPQQPYNSSGSNIAVSSHLNPNPPSNAYYPNSRTRANTINHMDRVPPALARLQHMSQDVISGRNALTPVLNRDDAIQEWERRQSGKATAAQPYPQLEFLQQQAELAAASGIASWQQPGTRYQPAQSSGLAHQYHPPATIVVDDERRDAIISNVRATAQGQSFISNPISNPPAAYTGSATTGGRFSVTYPQQSAAGSQPQPQPHSQPPPPQPQQQQQQSPTSPFDSLDRRPDMGGLYVPLQPDHFPPYTGTSVAGGRSAVAPPAPAAPPSFYDSAVSQQANAAPLRNPFSGDASSTGSAAPGSSGNTNVAKDRRGSGIEFWPR